MRVELDAARLVGRALLLECPVSAGCRVHALALLVALLSERACAVVLLPAGQVPAWLSLLLFASLRACVWQRGPGGGAGGGGRGRARMSPHKVL